MREANDVINLNQLHSNLKAEIEKSKQMKNNYSLNQNTNYQPELLPLGLPKYYYEQSSRNFKENIFKINNVIKRI